MTAIPVGLCSWPGDLPLTPHLDRRAPVGLNTCRSDLFVRLASIKVYSTCTHWLLESQTSISPAIVTATPCGFVNSPLPRPLEPMAIIRSSSMAFLLDPREFQEFALIGLDPGVDLLLLILLLGLGSDAEYDRTVRLVSSSGRQVI